MSEKGSTQPRLRYNKYWRKAAASASAFGGKARPLPAPFQVYLVRNTATGEGYVGQTCRTLVHRWSQHREKAKDGRDSLLHIAMRAQGVSVFEIQVLNAVASEKAAHQLEKFWIRELGTKAPNGYNMTDGGKGHSGHTMNLGRAKVL